MKNKVTLLRICYWWGIIADAVMAVLMLFPELYVRFMRVELVPDVGFRFGLANGAPLMIGWTILLLWADRRPVERRDVLLLTLPVVVGYVFVEAYSVLAGLAPLGQALSLFAMQAGMISLFTFSYLNARDAKPAVRKA